MELNSFSGILYARVPPSIQLSSRPGNSFGSWELNNKGCLRESVWEAVPLLLHSHPNLFAGIHFWKLKLHTVSQVWAWAEFLSQDWNGKGDTSWSKSLNLLGNQLAHWKEGSGLELVGSLSAVETSHEGDMGPFSCWDLLPVRESKGETHDCSKMDLMRID